MKTWSHYADDCRGVVVGYNVDSWVRHLIGTSVIRQVTYADRPPLVLGPRVLNQENAYGFMSCKGASWEDEQEWRLITELSKAQQAREGIAVITVPQQSVSSVAITDRMSMGIENGTHKICCYLVNQRLGDEDPLSVRGFIPISARSCQTCASALGELLVASNSSLSVSSQMT